MQAGTEASRCSEGSGRKSTSSEQMVRDLSGIRTVWYVIRTDGTVDIWASRRDGTIIRTADREAEIYWLVSSAESSETLLNSRIPVKQHLYIQVILSKQNEANHNLISLVWTYVHLIRKLRIQLQLSGRLPIMVQTCARLIWKLRVED
jgi:hypothetical protein